MATPTSLPASFVTGNVLTAAQMNNLRGAFRILQIVEGTATASVSNSTTTYSDTGLSATITPSASTNQILCFALIVGAGKQAGNANSAASFRILRGATQIHTNLGNFYTGSSLDNFGSVVLFKLDSPATTSATTYKVQIKNDTAAAAVYAQINGVSGTSVMILAEVSA